MWIQLANRFYNGNFIEICFYVTKTTTTCFSISKITEMYVFEDEARNHVKSMAKRTIILEP